MTSVGRPIQPSTTAGIEARPRTLGRVLLGGSGVDDLEMRHLLEVLRRTSQLMADEYDASMMDAVLSGAHPPATLLECTVVTVDREEGRFVYRIETA